MKKIECCATRGRLVHCLLLALAATLLASCSKKSERQPVFPVTGRLVDGDKPADRAVMFFHPAGSSDTGRLLPVGRVAADGSFQVSTYVANDGAPPGEYVVTVIWPKIPKDAPADWTEGPDQLEGRCSNLKTSPWHFRVENKASDLGTLDLRAWPKPGGPGGKPAAQPKASPGKLD